MKKKIILILLLSIGIGSVSKAQYTIGYDSKLHIGFELGVNISAFTNDVGLFDKKGPHYANGPFDGSRGDVFFTGHFGITLDKQISPSLSLATELLWNGRGG